MTCIQNNTDKWIRIMGIICVVFLIIICARMAIPLTSIAHGQIEVDLLAEENSADTIRVILQEIYYDNSEGISSIPTIKLPSQICIIENNHNIDLKTVMCVKGIAYCYVIPQFVCLLLTIMICIMIATGHTFSNTNYYCLLFISLIFISSAVLLPIFIFFIIPVIMTPALGNSIVVSYNIETTFKSMAFSSIALLGAFIIKTK